jgi:hypothetical protein
MVCYALDNQQKPLVFFSLIPTVLVDDHQVFQLFLYQN